MEILTCKTLTRHFFAQFPAYQFLKVILYNQANTQHYYFIQEINVNAHSLDVPNFTRSTAAWSTISCMPTRDEEIFYAGWTGVSLIFCQRSTCTIISFRTTTLAGFSACTWRRKSWFSCSWQEASISSGKYMWIFQNAFRRLPRKMGRESLRVESNSFAWVQIWLWI